MIEIEEMVDRAVERVIGRKPERDDKGYIKLTFGDLEKVIVACYEMQDRKQRENKNDATS